MKLIHQYKGWTALKEYTLDWSDGEIFKKNFGLSDTTVEALTTYLHRENIEVRINECYDPQSSWRGEHFIINGEDLSKNGYCFSEIALSIFLTTHL